MIEGGGKAAARRIAGRPVTSPRGRKSEPQYTSLTGQVTAWQKYFGIGGGSGGNTIISASTRAAIIQAAYIDPDLASARESLVSLAATPFKFVIEERSEGDVRRMTEILDRFTRRVNINTLRLKYLDQTICTGAISSEDVISADGRMIESIELVPVLNIEFELQNGRWVKYQMTTKGQKIDLEIPTYRYLAIKTTEGSPYALPPFLAAMKYVLQQQDADKNVAFILRKMGLMGMIQASVETPEGFDWRDPESEEGKIYRQALAETLESFMENYYNGVMVTPGDVTTSHMNPAGDARGSFELLDRIMDKKMSGAGVNGGIVGNVHSAPIQTFATVVYRLMVRRAESFQENSCDAIVGSAINNMAFEGMDPTGLWGEFESNPAYDPQAEAQGRNFEVMSDIALLDRGVISIDDLAQKHWGKPAFDPSKAYNGPAGNSPFAALQRANPPLPHPMKLEAGIVRRAELSVSGRGVELLIPSVSIYSADFPVTAAPQTRATSPERVIERQIGEYLASLSGVSRETTRLATEAAMDAVRGLAGRSFANGDEFAAAVWPRIVEAIAGQMSGDEVRQIADEYTTEFFHYWRIQDRSAFAGAAPAAGFTFGGADGRTSAFMSRVDRWFLSGYINGDDANRSGLAFLRDQYLQNGEGLFGRQRQESLEAFRRAVGARVDELNSYQIQRIVDTSVVRMRMYGIIGQMQEAGVEEGIWVTVGGACDICSPYNSKPFPVGKAYREMQRATFLEPEAFVERLREGTALRQRLGSPSAHLSSGLSIDPLHPNCRCRMVANI